MARRKTWKKGRKFRVKTGRWKGEWAHYIYPNGKKRGKKLVIPASKRGKGAYGHGGRRRR